MQNRTPLFLKLPPETKKPLSRRVNHALIAAYVGYLFAVKELCFNGYFSNSFLKFDFKSSYTTLASGILAPE